MGIQALPSTTVRAIGAGQVLTSSSSVVKELVDNALDARASTIVIEISANTLDSVQVRDNGTSIPRHDRSSLGKRHCTSKLSHESELRNIGGSSLGFRGEALASMAEISGCLTISVRCDDEQVATVLKIDREGRVDGHGRASLPVGTTVKVTDFLKTNAVRRQLALKHPEQTIKEIKHTLQTYAFARPNVRLALRVLKAKTDKDSWIYAPNSNGRPEDLVRRILGLTSSSQCEWSVFEHAGYILHAYLPRADAQLERLVTAGAWISCDGRPVSASKGTFKRIVKTFREALRKANASLESARDPFIYLDMQCPPGSYDVNVEPGKDDVLFQSSSDVLGAIQQFFDLFYAVPTSEETQIAQTDKFHSTFDIADLLSPFPSSITTAHDRSHALDAVHSEEQGNEDVALSCPQVYTSMFDVDKEAPELLEPSQDTVVDAGAGQDVQSEALVAMSNPWVIAKLHRRVQHPVADFSSNQAVTLGRPPLMPPSSPAQVDEAARATLLEPGLPTPRPSSPPPQDGIFPSSEPFASWNSRVVTGLASQQYRPSQIDFSATRPAKDLPSGRSLEVMPTHTTRPRRKTIRQRPSAGTDVRELFVSPAVVGTQRDKVWFDHLENIERRPRKPRYPAGSDNLVSQGEHGDVEDARPPSPTHGNKDIRDLLGACAATQANGSATESRPDKVGRSRIANYPDSFTALERNVDDNETPTGAISGRQALPVSEVAALRERIGALNNSKTSASKSQEDDDHRALRELSPKVACAVPNRAAGDPIDRHIVSRRRSTFKLHRSKSARLPLECIPKGTQTQDLIKTVNISTARIHQLMQWLDEKKTSAVWSSTSTDIIGTSVFTDDPSQHCRLFKDVQSFLTGKLSDGSVVEERLHIISHALQTLQEGLSSPGF